MNLDWKQVLKDALKPEASLNDNVEEKSKDEPKEKAKPQQEAPKPKPKKPAMGI
ncbi:hypothetical protein [Burkholderia contaminans]|uniref:hypothetical protein n=1 Tax=Burkholderia contaminans TaxID=488447 RepID=UPI0015890639|nr:hypothetical protein [Burkholderia contaminans]